MCLNVLYPCVLSALIALSKLGASVAPPTCGPKFPPVDRETGVAKDAKSFSAYVTDVERRVAEREQARKSVTRDIECLARAQFIAPSEGPIARATTAAATLDRLPRRAWRPRRHAFGVTVASALARDPRLAVDGARLEAVAARLVNHLDAHCQHAINQNQAANCMTVLDHAVLQPLREEIHFHVVRSALLWATIERWSSQSLKTKSARRAVVAALKQPEMAKFIDDLSADPRGAVLVQRASLLLASPTTTDRCGAIAGALDTLQLARGAKIQARRRIATILLEQAGQLRMSLADLSERASSQLSPCPSTTEALSTLAEEAKRLRPSSTAPLDDVGRAFVEAHDLAVPSFVDMWIANDDASGALRRALDHASIGSGFAPELGVLRYAASMLEADPDDISIPGIAINAYRMAKRRNLSCVKPGRGEREFLKSLSRLQSNAASHDIVFDKEIVGCLAQASKAQASRSKESP